MHTSDPVVLIWCEATNVVPGSVMNRFWYSFTTAVKPGLMNCKSSYFPGFPKSGIAQSSTMVE